MNNIRYYNILLPIVNSGVFTYSTVANINLGTRVFIDFHNREMTGIILEEVPKPSFKCKDIIMIYDESPLFSESYIKFIRGIANYYHSPLGLVLYGILSEKLLNCIDAKPFINELQQIEDITYNDEQLNAIDAITYNRFNTLVIDGVTGSGKTEVYMAIAKNVLKDGGQVLYIVPEISLTPQLIQLIGKRLGYTPATFHSKLDNKKRESVFLSFSRSEIQFVIGARSAIFIPAKNIRLIIIDEEHEASYKQDEAPSYHLRDMAVLYSSILGIPIILGSATPSIETIYNIKKSKYKLVELTKRSNNAIMPSIHVVDIKNKNLVGGIIEESIFDNLSSTIARGEQAIIFLNRKGYSTSLYCRSCGQILECDNCSVALVYYKSKDTSNCRYCNTNYKRVVCKRCGEMEFTEYGTGTEKIEEVLEELFPNKVLRIDLETVSTLKSLKQSLKRFEDKEAQILIGTQLVTKGLHFPFVTFVAILGIDNILSMPDFRSTERAYQQILQVAGRAGREKLKGEVYIQTVDPNTDLFDYILNNDKRYYEYEITRRKEANYPPFSKLIRISFTYSNREKIHAVSKKVADAIRSEAPNIKLLGPAEDIISIIKKKFRLSILLKSKNNRNLNVAIDIAKQVFGKAKIGAMIMKIDKDPYRF